MRKLSLFLVSFIFTLSVTSSALGWYCPRCDLDNEDNFCEECGQAKAEEELLCTQCGYDAALIPGAVYCPDCGTTLPVPEKISKSIAISEVTPSASGSVHLTWSDSAATGPYKLGYRQASADTVMPVYTLPETIEGTEGDLPVPPGKDYTLYVFDAKGYAASVPYSAPAAGKFESFPVPIKVQLRTLWYHTPENRIVLDFAQFDIPTIVTKMATEDFAMRVTPTLPQLSKPRHYTWMLTVQSPGGFTFVADFAAMDVANNKMYYEAVVLDDYFTAQMDAFGSVETGKHTVTLYWDGMYVSETTFTVVE